MNNYNKKNKSYNYNIRRNVKSNNTAISILLLVLLFTSFFSFIYLKKLEKDYSKVQLETRDKTHNAYMKCYDDNTFRPNQDVTRAEIAYALANLDFN